MLKALLLFLPVLVFTTFAAAAPAVPITTSHDQGVYGIHLFFNETEFVDVLSLDFDPAGLKGHMHVPDDFDGEIANAILQDQQIEFDLFVPKNGARPTDLIFHYQGVFFDETRKQLTGTVTIKGEKTFLAAFVGFRR